MSAGKRVDKVMKEIRKEGKNDNEYLEFLKEVKEYLREEINLYEEELNYYEGG